MTTGISPIQNALFSPNATPSSNVTKAANGFGEIMSQAIKQVNDSQNNSDTSMNALGTGSTQHLHEVMISTEEADISLRMLVQMRNKALSAYEEIMRMQV